MGDSITMERIEADRNNEKRCQCRNSIGNEKILGVILIDIMGGEVGDICSSCIMGTAKC